MEKKTHQNFWYKIFQHWSNDKVSTLSAAFAYFSLFSLTPLLVICITIAGIILGKSAAQANILNTLTSVLGVEGGKLLSQMIHNAGQHSTSIIAMIVSFILLLFGAIGFFSQLLDGLNIILNAHLKTHMGLMGMIKSRLFAFIVVLVLSLLLFFWISLSISLAFFQKFIPNFLPLQLLHTMISLGVIFLFFLLLYKYLPDVNLYFKDVWLGAIFATILFLFGQLILAWYFKKASLSNEYGVAGSTILIIFWLYYFGQILFLGAEFIKVNLKKNATES